MSSFGVACIVNKQNGKYFIFKSKNLVKKIQNTRNQLNFGCHYNKELQNDWNKLGPDNFKFEIFNAEIKNEMDLNDYFHRYLDEINYVYNKDVEDLIHPLNCDKQILINKLYDFTGNEINSQSFIQKLKKHGLTNQDGFDFKVKFIDEINYGSINYANFDEKYENFFVDFSLNSILKELNFDDIIKEYGLTEEDKIRIIDVIKDEISKGKINNKKDISKKIDSLITDEYKKKLRNDKIYERLYDLTGKKNRLSREFEYTLANKGLTTETGFKIKKDLEKLIENNEVTEFNIEDTLKILIEKAFEDSKEGERERKHRLIEYLNKMNFDDVLHDHNLHENYQFYIKEEITILINQNKIKSQDDIEIKSYSKIKDLELIDVTDRLKDLDGKIVDKIMVNNNLKSRLMITKQSKINKIIKNVPVNIIKDDLEYFVGKLEPIFIPNPNVVYCPQCAKQHEVGTAFCDQCGSKIK